MYINNHPQERNNLFIHFHLLMLFFSQWQEFVEKFRILFPQGTAATPAHITALFEWMALDKKTYQIGKTKVDHNIAFQTNQPHIKLPLVSL